MKKAYMVIFGLALMATGIRAQRITDYDGNVYDTIYIGNLAWFKQNLKVTHYSNGVPIPNVTDTSAWATLLTGARCYYANDSAAYDSVYGALDNWYAANDNNKICPNGWRVPTNAEWEATEAALGGVNIAGGKMKESGILHWAGPNVGATNSSGFTGLPGGMRDPLNNNFLTLTENGLWWTSTPSGSAAWSTYLWYLFTGVDHNPTPKQYGLSIRCVRDIGIGTGNSNYPEKVRIYPNPASGKVTIEHPGKQELNIRIINSAGLLVLHYRFYYPGQEMDVSSLSKGIYLVKISCPEWTVQKKLVKQ